VGMFDSRSVIMKKEGGGVAISRGFLGTSVADPDPGSGAFLTPGSGIRDGSKIRIRDEQPGSCFRELRNIFLS
jgi:hypothetical protein